MNSTKNNFDYCFVMDHFYVKETNQKEKKITWIWSITELRVNANLHLLQNNVSFSFKLLPKEGQSSLRRTKKWLEQNHPELML